MKTYLIPIFSLVLSSALAFSSTAKKNKIVCNEADPTGYIWFQVNSGKTCATLTMSDIVLIRADGAFDISIFNNALIDICRNNPFGCLNETLEACAIGYFPNQANFEIIQSLNGDYYWKPKELNYYCCITHSM